MPNREFNIGIEADRRRDNKSEKKENIRKLHKFSEATSQEIIEKYGGKQIVNKNIKINTKFFCENTFYTEEKIKGGI